MATILTVTTTKLDSGGHIENSTDNIKQGAKTSEELTMIILNQLYSKVKTAVDALAVDGTVTFTIDAT
jgi:hypothetical protein